MGIWIQISPGSAEPIYAQIVSQIARAIARGELATGDRLPPVRKLAEELVVNPNTVARAYRLLEQQGLTSSKTGSGSFIADPAHRHGDAGNLGALAERIDTILTQALNMGMDPKQITRLFETRLKRFAANRREDKGK